MSKMFIIVPISILILLSSIYALYNIQPLSNTANITFNSSDIIKNPTIDGTTTGYEETGQTFSVTVTETLGIMAIIAVIEAIAVIAGIQVLGSGLNETSTMIIYKSAGLTILWSIFSVTSLQVLLLIPFSLGLLLWLFLTLFYAVGIINSV